MLKKIARSKMKQVIIEYVTEEVTDFELTWVYHGIFHESLNLMKDLPKRCKKCKTLQK